MRPPITGKEGLSLKLFLNYILVFVVITQIRSRIKNMQIDNRKQLILGKKVGD